MTGRVEAMDGGVEMAEGREGGGYEKMGIEKTKHLQGKQLFRVSFFLRNLYHLPEWAQRGLLSASCGLYCP